MCLSTYGRTSVVEARVERGEYMSIPLKAKGAVRIMMSILALKVEGCFGKVGG